MQSKLLFGLLTFCSLSMAEGDPHSLAGITKVLVLVKSAGPQLPGLSDDVIRTDVEAQLGMWGINPGADPPIIFHITYSVAPEMGAYFSFINIWQWVEPVRDPSIRALISTWSTADSVTNAKPNTVTPQALREAIHKLVSQFLAAWLGENPDAKITSPR